MFRKMRRFKQQLSEEKCIQILNEQPRGVLSMIGDDGYPYGIPMTHWYSEKDGKIYFHCAKEGHKIDALNACNKVSFCVTDTGFRRSGEWALNISSVVVFGRINTVSDEDKKREICINLCRKFTDDENYIRKELASAFSRVNCLELEIEHMTGKLVNES
ncbi:MAG: pyridoxamine 5'-phosphate oxidase family protein [Ruminococcus sp.]|nr:pyridoxamine 5'-phosphate oxidase family protein [Ruminococcus sp.]